MPNAPVEPQEGEAARLPANGGRSQRQRFRPLEFWRGERKVYGRRDSAKFEAVVDVVVAERDPTPPHFRRQKEKAAQSSKLAQHSQRAGGGAASSSTDPLANAQDAMAEEEEDGPVIAPPKR